MLNAVDPWAPLIFKFEYDFKFDDVLKAKLDEHIASADVVPIERDGGFSSVASKEKPPHAWEELQPFLTWFRPHIGECFKAWRFRNDYAKIAGSWVNRHDKGGWTAEHQHRGCEVAVAAYFKVPENGGKFLVRDPLEYAWSGSIQTFTDMHESNHKIDVKTNDIRVFPSFLYHMTEANQSDDPRYVLSLNIKNTP
jgi:uncharacterized protein (TIGR02466 family)